MTKENELLRPVNFGSFNLILKTNIKNGEGGGTDFLPFLLNSMKDAGGGRGAASCDLLLQP